MKLLVVLLAAGIAARAGVVTHQSATSSIRASGVLQADQSNTVTDSRADSQAIWPAPPTTVQGRTAARSRVEEIGANAMILDTGFSHLLIDEVISAATYQISVDVESVSRNAMLSFFLPPSYMEIESNAETQFYEMQTVLLADLRVCYALACSSSDRRFSLQSTAEVSFASRSHSVRAEGDPQLDLSTLLNPVVTFTPGGFLNTYLVEFPEFTGMLDLGYVPVGSTITVEYQIQARARGRAALNQAIAAINDPFALETDPLRQGAPLALSFTPAVDPVPEPAAGWLVLGGVAIFLFRRVNLFR